MNMVPGEDAFTDTLRTVRRTLHACPETGFALDRTRKYLLGLLRDAGFSPREVAGGLVADIGTGPSGVLLRADMDALPVADAKDVPYASGNPGVCHACGHDGHMAMLYGAALLLKGAVLPGRVRFMFQPAEEMVPGGAKGMIEVGVLEGMDFAFALHLNPQLPLGVAATKAGVLMASNDNFRLTIHGRGGHAAAPHKATDAIYIAAQVINGLQSLVSRFSDPVKPLVISVGRITGGTAGNIVADRVVLDGTVRTLSRHLREEIPGKIKEMADGICSTYHATCGWEYGQGYPVLCNDADAVGMVEETVNSELGEGRYHAMHNPTMGSEDFSYVLEKVKGAFVFLGTKDENENYPLHHPCFDFDEKVLPAGAHLLAALALNALC